jgi:hypothetical protein
MTWAAVAVLAALATGFGAGWGLKPDVQDETLQAQAEALVALQASQQQLVESANRPVVLDAELRAQLAGIPVQCLKDMGGDPNSVQCLWSTCLQFGQSAAQRPECRQVEQLMIDTMKVK